jgi:hypothetical protein
MSENFGQYLLQSLNAGRAGGELTGQGNDISNNRNT